MTDHRKLLMAGAVEKVSESVGRDGATVSKVVRKGVKKDAAVRLETATEGIPFAKMLRCRVR